MLGKVIAVKLVLFLNAPSLISITVAYVFDIESPYLTLYGIVNSDCNFPSDVKPVTTAVLFASFISNVK